MKLLTLSMVFAGTVLDLSTVWSLAGITSGLMAMINIVESNGLSRESQEQIYAYDHQLLQEKASIKVKSISCSKEAS